MRRLDPHLLVGIAVFVLLALPPLAVQITPVSDLPQQLAQIPLFLEHQAGRAQHLAVHWLAPNKISYPLLAAAWLAFEPLAAARAALVGMAAVWVASVFWLARRRRRPAAQAVLASLLLYNHLFGFGFFNFVLGLGSFFLWLEATDPATRASPRRSLLRLAGAGLLLYFSHALWLAAGLGWMLVSWVLERPPAAVRQRQALGILPALALFLLWYPAFLGMGWDSLSVYGPLPWERLSPQFWVPSTLGAVHGPLEPVLLAAIGVWLGVGAWQRRHDLPGAVDRRLLLAGLTLLAAAVLLPIKVDKTLGFATRYLPMAAVLLILALPAPRIRRRVQRGLAVAVAAAFALSTAAIWVQFERHELDGLRPALERLPVETRLLGLDYYRDSPRVRYPAYLQTFAYAQLLADASLNFSFTDLPSSLVVRRVWEEDPWTPHLEWKPEDLTDDDLGHFDYALVHAPARRHRRLTGAHPRLEPVTQAARWRLYRIGATSTANVDTAGGGPRNGDR